VAEYDGLLLEQEHVPDCGNAPRLVVVSWQDLTGRKIHRRSRSRLMAAASVRLRTPSLARIAET
jgi:hypothetical protein